jgi:hypothetical protein
MPWAHFCEQIVEFVGNQRWTAAINGKPWKDDSWAPSRSQNIRVNISLGGGIKKDKF